VFEDAQVQLYCGDARALLPEMAPASVQLILVDPPYFRVKDSYLGEQLTWDRQWKTRQAYLDWLRTLAKEWQRVLAPNGSLYVFASPQLAAWVEVTLSETFHVIQRITWRKPPYSTKAEMFEKDAQRMFFPASEAIIFAEHLYSDALALGESGYHFADRQLKTSLFSIPIAEAMQGTGANAREVTEAIGAYSKVNHGGAVSNWLLGLNIPTKAQYEAMRTYFKSHDTQEYSYLRQEYEDLRRPFTVTKDVPYTDTWDFATVPYQPGKHPAEKPLPLLRHIINASSRPGDLVLDSMAGSGATLEAARQCGRHAIGIELDPAWCAKAASGLKQQWLF
jgi:adenine-specific DNA-methyltransferase